MSYKSHHLLIAGLEVEIITQTIETTNIVRHKQYYRDKRFVPTPLYNSKVDQYTEDMG